MPTAVRYGTGEKITDCSLVPMRHFVHDGFRDDGRADSRRTKSPDGQGAVERYRTGNRRSACRAFTGVSLPVAWRWKTTGLSRLGVSPSAESHFRSRLLLASPRGLCEVSNTQDAQRVLVEQVRGKRDERQAEPKTTAASGVGSHGDLGMPGSRQGAADLKVEEIPT